jgi:catechol 2,3-dioxygenase
MLEAAMRIGHVNFRVADQDRAKQFFTEALGMEVAEEDPVHGGVFMTFGAEFHNVDVSDGRGGIPRRPRPPGLVHVAFVVDSMPALREAYVRLMAHGVEVSHATNHANQRSIYFKDPDGNGMEIYYEIPEAKRLFWGGRGDTEETLAVSKPGEPLPAWLFEDDWPRPETLSEILAGRPITGQS